MHRMKSGMKFGEVIAAVLLLGVVAIVWAQSREPSMYSSANKQAQTAALPYVSDGSTNSLIGPRPESLESVQAGGALTVAGGIPGDSYALSVVSDTLYAGIDNSFQILSITTPDLPMALGSLDVGQGIDALAVSFPYAYAIDSPGNLHVIDVTSATSPTVLITMALGVSAPVAAEVEGDHLFVAAAGDGSPSAYSGLYVVDISNPHVPALAHVMSVGSDEITDLLLYQQRLFVSTVDLDDSAASIGVYDSITTTSVSRVADYVQGGQFSGMAAMTSTLLANSYDFAGGEAWLDSIDVSEPEEPALSTRFEYSESSSVVTGGGAALSPRPMLGLLATDGKRVVSTETHYVMPTHGIDPEFERWVRLLEVDAMDELSSIDALQVDVSGFYDVELKNGYVYLAGGHGGVKILEASLW